MQLEECWWETFDFYRGKKKWGIFRKQEWATANFLNRLYRFEGAFRIEGRSTCCPVGSLLLLIIAGSITCSILSNFFFLPTWNLYHSGRLQDLHNSTPSFGAQRWTHERYERLIDGDYGSYDPVTPPLTQDWRHAQPWGAARYAGHVGGHRIALQNNRGVVQSTG